MNFPITQWKYPAYDFVQIEDYDWIIEGNVDRVPLTFQAATEVLNYPLDVVHYFLGFVLVPEDGHIWTSVDQAWALAKKAEIPHIYLWAYSQVMRDSILAKRSKVCGC